MHAFLIKSSLILRLWLLKHAIACFFDNNYFPFYVQLISDQPLLSLPNSVSFPLSSSLDVSLSVKLSVSVGLLTTLSELWMPNNANVKPTYDKVLIHSN